MLCGQSGRNDDCVNVRLSVKISNIARVIIKESHY